MTCRPDALVIGNSVGAMAAAERIADAGLPVVMLCTGTPGSAFAEYQLGARPVGLGLRLIEREYVAGENAIAPPPLHEHIPGHAGHRRWMPLVADYLDDLVPDLAVSETPVLQRGSRLGEDFTLTGRLAAMRDLFSAAELVQIQRDGAAALEFYGQPAGILADLDHYHRSSLETASISNHGALFHSVIVDPLADALVEGGAAAIAADQRHKVWAPIYWPETLVQATSGTAVTFCPDRRFWIDTDGGMSTVVKALWDRLVASDLVTISRTGPLESIERGLAEVTSRFRDGSEWTHPNPILGVSPAELFAAAGVPFEPDRVLMTIGWAQVPEHRLHRLGATTILDSHERAFRITTAAPRVDRTGQVGRAVAVEFRRSADPAAIDVGSAIARAGLIDDPVDAQSLGTRSFAAFAAPTAANRQTWAEADALFTDRVGEVRRVGGAAGYGADPLNEQLFSGIRTALEMSHAYV